MVAYTPPRAADGVVMARFGGVKTGCAKDERLQKGSAIHSKRGRQFKHQRDRGYMYL